MSFHVHLLGSDDETAAQTLLAAALTPGITLSRGEQPLQETRIIVGGRPTADMLDHCPDLQAVIVPWAGIPTPTQALLAERPHLTLHNLHHNAPMVAEVVLMLLLAVSRRLPMLDRNLRQNDWTLRYTPPPTPLLAGKNALLLGFGEIGQRVARACLALEMSVLAVRRNPTSQLPPDLASVAVFGSDDLPRLLPQAQALLISLPLTEATKGLIGAAELAAMPAGALLVNVGRGAVIDAEALYLALKSGHLGGAGLDVWYNYPTEVTNRTTTPPADFPFGELENVVLTPHMAGHADESDTLRMQALAKLLNAAASGQPMPNKVDVLVGY